MSVWLSLPLFYLVSLIIENLIKLEFVSSFILWGERVVAAAPQKLDGPLFTLPGFDEDCGPKCNTKTENGIEFGVQSNFEVARFHIATNLVESQNDSEKAWYH